MLLKNVNIQLLYDLLHNCWIYSTYSNETNAGLGTSIRAHRLNHKKEQKKLWCLYENGWKELSVLSKRKHTV